MAEYLLYKCNSCGWEIAAPSGGADILFDSYVEYFVCHDCKAVFRCYYELGTVNDETESCPKCKGHRIDKWNPSDSCPKCGGILENQGLYCLED